jgi:hypothetical protein
MKVKCLGIAALERCMWRQRSRFLWLKEGDCNSKFFHVKASARWRKSFIPSITTNDVTTVFFLKGKRWGIPPQRVFLINNKNPNSHPRGFEPG